MELTIGNHDSWISMRYPMKKSMRVHLGALFYEIATTPAFGPHANAVASGAVEVLLRYASRSSLCRQAN
jgi:hypothetical protein